MDRNTLTKNRRFFSETPLIIIRHGIEQSKSWKMARVKSHWESACFCFHIVSSSEWNTEFYTNAWPTLLSPLFWWASMKACASLLLLSTSLRVAVLLSAAALAPGPSCASRSSRHMAWLLTTCTDMARRISPITFPRSPGPASQPLAQAMAAHLASARYLRRAWKSLERQPQGPATSLPWQSPP